MPDLFQAPVATPNTYTAQDIEVLEGLEPVRRRPGMYIGGTDDRALHHLVAEVLDNSMDEAVAGHATRIELAMQADGSILIRDNGRGIPVDPHPKFPDKSALEVILTTLHSGGKFAGKAYATSGGLHGVGISVVNALSDQMMVEVARDRQLYRQYYSRGLPQGPIENIGAVNNRRGTTVVFHPDVEIFGPEQKFRPERLYKMARSKAYLHRGVEIRWSCPQDMLAADSETPAEETLHFPGGLLDFLNSALGDRAALTPTAFAGEAPLPEDQGKVEWAITWPEDADGFCHSYCNTIPTPQGGSHELGLRTALSRSIKAYGELINNKRASIITPDDIINGACIVLSAFIREPQFQGQTKEKLATPAATRLVDIALKDRFDLWLSADNNASKQLLDTLIERAEERLRARMAKDTARKTATKRLRLPGKLADCSRQGAEGTEIFLVEGDSAGGSAKQARRRDTQAVLPLRGKILNVASASTDKLRGNQELSDLALALGTGIGKDFDVDALRYERVIIMTDADVDGAHIGSLLMTFFFEQMPGLIEKGRLFLAMPPLYRITQGSKSIYARDDGHKDELMKTVFTGRGKIEISRFKGLGEMPAAQLRDTTMDPDKRNLIKVSLRDISGELETKQIKGRNGAAVDLVNRLMGRNPESRFQFIQERARFAEDIDI